jgi:hypothetical protein
MRAVKIGLIAGLLALFASIAAAQRAPQGPVESESMAVFVPPGFAMTYMLPVPFATINVGDPRIADASATSDRGIIINGKAPGQTNLLFIDPQGREVVNLVVTVPNPGTPFGIVHIHSKLDNLHAYWAYQCLPREGAPQPLAGVRSNGKARKNVLYETKVGPPVLYVDSYPVDDDWGSPCFKIHDDNEGSDRVPPPRVVIQQNFNNPPPTDNTPPRQQ